MIMKPSEKCRKFTEKFCEILHNSFFAEQLRKIPSMNKFFVFQQVNIFLKLDIKTLDYCSDVFEFNEKPNTTTSGTFLHLCTPW